MKRPLLCLGCGYELPNDPATAGVCPECGRPFTHAELMLDAQRRLRQVVAVKVVLFAAVMVFGVLGAIKLLAWLISI